MKRTFATVMMLVAGILTVSLPSEAGAELTFGEWATAEGVTPPGLGASWMCDATNEGITSLDGINGYTNLIELWLGGNQISSLAANQFQGLSRLGHLELNNNQISSLAANQFQGLTNLSILHLFDNQISSLNTNPFQGLANLEYLWLNDNQISSLDLTGLEATRLSGFYIAGNPITEVILADTTLSQTTFDALMIADRTFTARIGIAELAGIASADFTAADMVGVDQFDEMFGMADLQTLILTDALFSEAIVADGYAEVWDLITALDANRLDALTVNRQLYTAMQTNLDTWDAGPGNVLTVVPEPSTLALLAIASLALLLWRRRA
ncbi:MAG: PEP-CTERM sorting domain-containing protein [Thermoguttaceae bacterium]